MAPSTPHFAEELWSLTGHPYSVHQQPFPSFDPILTVEDEITLVVQVNGKVREKLAVAAGISEDQAKAAALAAPKVAAQIDGRQPRQVIYVPGRLVNVVL